MTSATNNRARLERAYRRTAYCVEDSGATGDVFIDLRIGVRNAQIDRLLKHYGARSWAFVTAYNPDSQPLDARTNRRRQAAFERSIATPFLRGWGRGLTGNWEPEGSVLLVGASPHQAHRLAVRWQQAAVVVGVRGGQPRLLWRRAEIFVG